MGAGDLTQCFYCGVQLHSWEKTDIVEVEHILNSPECTYAQVRLSEKEVLPLFFKIIQQVKDLKYQVKELKTKVFKEEEEEEEPDVNFERINYLRDLLRFTLRYNECVCDGDSNEEIDEVDQSKDSESTATIDLEQEQDLSFLS